MKKLIAILLFACFAITANAQWYETIPADTLNGAETVNWDTPIITGSFEYITIQAHCTELGGTSDGTMILQGSVDGEVYQTLTDASGIIKGFTNDTLTITDGATQIWTVTDNPLNYYRVAGTGTADDTTYVEVKYLLR